jgi:hypothetical protein
MTVLMFVVAVSACGLLVEREGVLEVVPLLALQVVSLTQPQLTLTDVLVPDTNSVRTGLLTQLTLSRPPVAHHRMNILGVS